MFIINKSRYHLLEFLPNGIVGEIGVQSGNFSQAILEKNNPEKLHLIDSWENNYFDNNSNERQYNIVLKRFDYYIKDNIVEINKGFSENILKNFSDNYFDWVFFNKNDDYEKILENLFLIYRKIKDNGFIVGHNFFNENDNIKNAVNSFIEETKSELLILTVPQNDNSSFVISKKYNEESDIFLLNLVKNINDNIIEIDVKKLNLNKKKLFLIIIINL